MAEKDLGNDIGRLISGLGSAGDKIVESFKRRIGQFF